MDYITSEDFKTITVPTEVTRAVTDRYGVHANQFSVHPTSGFRGGDYYVQLVDAELTYVSATFSPSGELLYEERGSIPHLVVTASGKCRGGKPTGTVIHPRTTNG